MKTLWNAFWNPSFLTTSKEDPARYRVFLSVTLAIILTIATVIALLTHAQGRILTGLWVGVASMVVMILNMIGLFIHKKPRLSYWVLCLTPHMTIIEEVLRHGPGAPPFILVCASPATFGYFLGLPGLLFIVVTSQLTAIALKFGIPSPFLPLLGPAETFKPDGLIEAMSVTSQLFVCGLIWVYERARKAAEKTLTEMIQELELVFTTMTEGIVVQQPDGKIEKHNEAALQTLGLTADQLNGRTSLDPRWVSVHEDGSPFPGNDHPSMVALRTKKPVRDVIMGIFHPILNEHRWILINATPMFTGQGALKGVLSTFTDMTNELRARKEARQDAIFLRTLMDHSNMAVTALLESGTIKYVNTVSAAYFQLKPEQLKGKSFYDFLPPVFHDKFKAHFSLVFKTAKPIYLEEYFVRPNDGTKMTFRTVIFPIKNDGGQVEQVVRIDTDISEISKTRDFLLETQERLNIATRAINLAVWELNLETDEFRCDDNMFAIYEIERQESINVKVFQEFMVHEDALRFGKELTGAIEAIQNISTGFRIRTKSGNLKYMKLEGNIFAGSNGKASRIVGSIWDDTPNWTYRTIQDLARELDQQMLETRDQQTFLTRTLEIIAVKLGWDYGAHWALDRGSMKLKASGSIWVKSDASFPLTLSANQTFEPTPGEGIIGSALENRTALMIRNLVDYKASIRTRDLLGDQVASILAIPLRLGDDCVGLIEFMSKKTQVLHPELVSALESFGQRIGQFLSKLDTELQLVQSSKMSSLGEMAAGVAHEINNPLSVVKGKVNQLRNGIKKLEIKDPAIEKHLESIDRNADRISKIVKGLRAFSRDGFQDPYVLTPVRTLIDESLDLIIERFKDHGVELTPPFVDPQIQVACRPSEVEQVLINLLINALHATEKLAVRWIKIEVFDLNRDVEITITDSGGGIPIEIQNKLFQPFFTTKPQGKGTGLGLSIAARIIKAHQGSLTIDRNCANTRFVIALPKKRTDA